MLIFTADLEEIEEIGCGRVDRNEILGRRWDGIRESGYGKFVGTLWWYKSEQCTYVGNSTFRYSLIWIARIIES